MHSVTLRMGWRAALLASWMLWPGLARANDPGTAGFLSLRLGAGARSAGMGDAQVSLVNDATAAYWNPAGLASISSTSFTLMHNEWLSSARVETASLAHATGLGTFGVHFSGMYFDEIEAHLTASSEPSYHFNVFEIAVAGAYGRRLLDDWDVGVAVKGLVSDLDSERASGWAVDLGTRYRTRITGLSFAGAVQNLGPKIKFVEETFLLPVTGRAGADYQRNVPQLQGNVAAAFDLVWPTDGDVRQHVGLEYVYHQLAALRVGYKANYDSQGLTFGVGLRKSIRKSSYRFDYAYADIANDLGTGHKFALSLDF